MAVTGSDTTPQISSITVNNMVDRDDRKKFTLFPKLPLELRRKVWFFALPNDRDVCIMTWHCAEAIFTVDQMVKYADILRLRDPLPRTLHANQESRIEILHHYFVLPRVFKIRNMDIKVIPFTLDPESDIIFMPFALAFNEQNRLFWDEEFFLPQLGAQAAKCVARIEELRVEENCWEWFLKKFAEYKQRNQTHEVSQVGRPYCCVFRHLPALKCITFVWNFGAGDRHELRTSRQRKDFTEFMEGVLHVHKDIFRNGEIPKIGIQVFEGGLQVRNE